MHKYLYLLLTLFACIIVIQEISRRDAYGKAKANADSLRVTSRALAYESQRLGEKSKEVESLLDTVKILRKDIRRQDAENKETDERIKILQDSIAADTSITIPPSISNLLAEMQTSLEQKNSIILTQQNQIQALSRLLVISDSVRNQQQIALDKYEVLATSLTKSLDDAVNHQKKGFDKLAYILGVATVVVVASVTP